MEAAFRKLYWITELRNLEPSRFKELMRGSGQSTFVVYCDGNGITGDQTRAESLLALRHSLIGNGIQLIEMHGHCEQVIPSLARVLKVDKVCLVDADYCTCDPESVDEVRHRLNMHSIHFTTGLFSGNPGIGAAIAGITALNWISEQGFRNLPPVL